MSGQLKNDWNPETYSRFRGLRLRPAIDLLQQISGEGEGDIIDLGCGNGAVGEPLAERFAGHKIIGVDASEAMLVKASETRAYDDLVHAHIDHWQPARPPAVIFSNAALNWLGDHQALMPRLAAQLAEGGILAVQMPGQHNGPSHALAREIAVEMFPDRFANGGWNTDVLDPAEYYRILSDLGTVTAWETTYLQPLAAVDEGHPVRHFTQSTYLRPILDKLDADEQASYLAAYEAGLSVAYPLLPNGGVLFPFRRIFFVLET